jgi:hypothetical protein
MGDIATIFKKPPHRTLGGRIEETSVRVVPKVMNPRKVNFNKVAGDCIGGPLVLDYKPYDPCDIRTHQPRSPVG